MKHTALLVAFLSSFALAASGLKCYTCTSFTQSWCGPTEFPENPSRLQDCAENALCGTQIEPAYPNGEIPVLRACYYRGSLTGVEETVGCHDWSNPDDNFNATLCFCDTEGCNRHFPLQTTPN